MSRERARWERLARDPYQAVLNESRYADPTPGAREEFFRSGEAHVAQIMEAIRAWLDPGFAPARAIDYGCGVGRLVIPLARRCGHVLGIDISPAMLAEARRHCAERGVANVDFRLSEEFMAEAAPAPVDFVHSFIVLQHVAPRMGERVLDRLVAALGPGGIGALHLTYARDASPLRKAVHRLRRWVPGVNAAVNALQGRPLGQPPMPMYEYDVGRVLGRLARRGCGSAHLLLTDHGGHRGATFLFRVP
jgi:2-polyprenyl-3-methyl-5-hydroxy-6-metoxy-1,4-benzoquinol methylase